MADVGLPACIAEAGRVTRVQLAVGGQWEYAARVDAPRGNAPVAELTSRIPAKGESAVEVFAEDKSGSVVFIGVRFIDRARAGVESVVVKLCDIAFAQGGSLPRVSSWLSAVIGSPLFANEWSAIEVGVVDAWKSIGAVTLTRRNYGNDEAEAALLDSARQLASSPGRVIAAEFAFTAPVPHWFAIEVARSAAGGKITPSASARGAAAHLAGRRPTTRAGSDAGAER